MKIMKVKSIRLIACLMITVAFVGCYAATPKAWCKEELESTYQPACLAAMVGNLVRPSQTTETNTLLFCANYLQKKEECDGMTY